MAGHSFGGLYALTFAARHPDEVAGMVLIDSTSPHYDEVHGATSRPAPPVLRHRGPGRGARLLRVAAGTGPAVRRDRPVRPPAAERDQVQASTATPGMLRTTIEEYGRANDSMVEAASLHDFGDKPLMVLSAGVGSAADWPQKQDRLAALSTDSVHRVVDGASHEALVGDRTHALTTSRAILEVVDAVRTGQPLSQ